MKTRDKYERLLEFEAELSQLRDIGFLLEKILAEARAITTADAGSIYVREGNNLKFSYTQNDSLSRMLPDNELIYTTFTTPINSSSIAGYVAATAAPLNIGEVSKIPADAPYSFNSSFDKLSGYSTKSLLTIPLIAQRGEVSGILQLINAKGEDGGFIPFPEDGMPLIMHLATIAANAIERGKLTRGIILRMNKMAELRDPKETASHVNRVASTAVALYELWARKKSLPSKEIERNRDTLRLAAMLHDVGKVAISDMILKKPGRFTEDEYELMKQHTVHGARLFGEIYSDIDEAAMSVTLTHHERWDGTGYPGHVDIDSGEPVTPPRSKSGEEIPLFGRIVAIADVYDALSSRRCYKEPWSHHEVVEELKKESGKMFDPELLELFLEQIEMMRQMTAMYPD